MVEELTDAQRATLIAIRDLIDAGPSPTYAEIAARLGVRRETVIQSIHRLQRKGVLERKKGGFRTISLTRRGRIAANQPR